MDNQRATATRRRLPAWLKKTLPAGAKSAAVRRQLARLGLATVCSAAKCPNRAECFSRGVATFMILGEVCTRSCRFCAIPSGVPCPPRDDEPGAVAEAAAQLNLRHVVITSVTRDDLPDGGAGQFARTIRAVRRRLPSAAVEVLVPDFEGSAEAVDTVLSAGPDVFNHNVETVARLYPAARGQADYDRSLGLLSLAKRIAVAKGMPLTTKSGLMVGLGERPGEIRRVMGDLLGAGCDMLTIGQYLAPSPEHLPVRRFVTPGQFDALAREAKAMGFAAAACGPFVRSSYMAEQLFAATGA